MLDDRGRGVQWPGRAARDDDVGYGTAGRDLQWGRPYAALAAIGRSPSQAAAVRYVLAGGTNGAPGQSGPRKVGNYLPRGYSMTSG